MGFGRGKEGIDDRHVGHGIIHRPAGWRSGGDGSGEVLDFQTIGVGGRDGDDVVRLQPAAQDDGGIGGFLNPRQGEDDGPGGPDQLRPVALGADDAGLEPGEHASTE